MSTWWQEIAALGIVALVVAGALWRRYKRRTQKGCDQCQSGRDPTAPD